MLVLLISNACWVSRYHRDTDRTDHQSALRRSLPAMPRPVTSCHPMSPAADTTESIREHDAYLTREHVERKYADCAYGALIATLVATRSREERKLGRRFSIVTSGNRAYSYLLPCGDSEC
jgi:hypothetical protein